jgi:hypothetical protein
MCHITTWEEDYKGNNTSPSLQSPLANSSTPSCTYTASLYLITIEMRGEKGMGRETNRRQKKRSEKRRRGLEFV